ncbi:MAG: UV DNA damage repair endonuclease UvsE [Firmicutes bacterium HGW-Firmicutes-15]|nr:MAG: UV DNA damage repair endonuclease UvsE [Firmicutes bacterium HGW-Firmicutes-15]
MKIRFGYVAMSMILEDCSPSKTITVANLSKIDEEAARVNKLTSLANINLTNTQRLLYHNQVHDIKVFRITSKLVPLGTHPITQNWDWLNTVGDKLELLGLYVKNNGFRISAHPDHYTLLNSPKEEVFEKSIEDLEYHCKIFNRMGLDSSAKLVIHVGGCYGDKISSIQRFINNYNDLPQHLKNRIILENDDKIYTARDVLNICQHLGIPMVLDIHHHWCNNNNDDIKGYLPAIFDTWTHQTLVPKIHVSSPKDDKKFRSHADNIDPVLFLDFLRMTKNLNKDFDVMIEAKNKDLALFKLMNDLRNIPELHFTNEASIEY